jgi:acetylornithine deacetylase
MADTPAVDEALVAAIAAAVDARRDQLVALLCELVAVPSVTGSEGAVQEVVARVFAARALRVDRWEPTVAEVAPYEAHVGAAASYAGRPNVVGVLSGARPGGRSILLNAHVDTVAIGDRERWTRDPGGELVGGRFYGRGACDMKGGLVTVLVALDALSAAGVRLGGDVTLAATVGEEDGGVGALAAVLRGYRADAALITEPTRLALVTAQEGSLVFRLTVRGKAAHAAVRDEGVSALEKFLPLFGNLRAFERERNAALRHPLFDGMANKVPINVGVVRTGEWASTVPETLIAEIRVGFLPGEELEDVWQTVRTRIAVAAACDPWLRAHPPELAWVGGQFAAVETPPDAPICAAVRRAHARVTGRPPTTEGVSYGADMRHFVLTGGVPCVMYGAGDVRVAHQADEYLDVAEALTAAKTIAGLLADWCGVEPPPDQGSRGNPGGR